MKFIFVILGIAILPLITLFQQGLPITHDGIDHVARIASFYESLMQGNIVPRWAGNLNWGYGHPILMFLYPFPSYVGSLFHAVGFSLVDSTKLVFIVAFVASVLGMYVWINTVWGSRAGIVAAILYGFAPYRFVDLYVRGAIGEHMAFVFPPIICLGLYAMAKQRKYGLIVFVIGLALLILSHNAVSLMFLPIFLMYAVYCYIRETENKKRFIVVVFVGFGFGFLLSAFFWFPALIEGKYTLRDIVTRGDFVNRFVPIQWFLYSSWNYGGGNEFSKSIGFVHLALLLYSLLFTSKNKMITWGLYSFFIFSIFLMTRSSLFLWQEISIIQKFQFPWRFLTVTVFASSVIGGLLFAHAKRNISMVIVCFFAVVLSIHMWKPVRFQSFPDAQFMTNYPGTTDTGESSPIWSVRFMESFPSEELSVVDGLAEITQLVRTTTKHEYVVHNLKQTMFVENTLYFPGWRVFVDEREIVPQYQNPDYRGRMMFMVPVGEHTIRISFTETKLRKIANSISVSSLILGTIYLWYLFLLPLQLSTKKKI